MLRLSLIGIGIVLDGACLYSCRELVELDAIFTRRIAQDIHYLTLHRKARQATSSTRDNVRIAKTPLRLPYKLTEECSMSD